MLEKVKKFYKNEFKGLERALDRHYAWANPQEQKNNALQRMLGVAYFVQGIDIDLRDIEALYNKYRVKIEAL